uniref:ADF-H domain-containing protein n=1 Tax=Zooxanthella nutricula TaxID=1333877 RepID=A0A6U6TV89_9DINO|mmetsp:Transcript_81840/g.250071  ORF Transcript_81840/g.250071 Transcript_81840/m.250071 type:complete len:142 (+) Transcript_81840:113-538(+)|eukprot:CAMPEP_0198537646 /NCGR_PEP_ID=MMETSP1462-20131121/44525_1 /TAXON_ID=1333877 /ORGANISM="Brandtodinium nutriculum, Strain RCC3387" /LENGTH=141 /DNA_ID=CAMNT_0044267647 /DNA_START=96 /DNA_END=521 /DNA_ORIENTATION=-
MAVSGVKVDDTCLEAYTEIKMGKKLRFVLFKIEDKTNIVVERKEEKTDGSTGWDAFVEAVPDAEPRYALIEVDYKTEDGRDQSKLTFVFWSPDDGPVKEKMLYASTKDTIKKKFTGIMKEVQANDKGDLEYKNILELMLRK